MRGSTILVRLILMAYLGLLVQPCVWAMGHGAADRPHHCHHGSRHLDAETCMSQPTSDCGADGSIFDGRDSWPVSAEPLLVELLPVDPGQVVAPPVADSRYFSRAPPPGQPALSIRHCKFLK